MAQAALDSERNTSGKPIVLDAGIVLLDRDGYLCVPLQRLGLSANSELASVTSSCPCAQAEIINYAGGRGQTSRALLLTFRAESPNDLESTDAAAIRKPVELDVKIEIKLESGIKDPNAVERKPLLGWRDSRLLRLLVMLVLPAMLPFAYATWRTGSPSRTIPYLTGQRLMFDVSKIDLGTIGLGTDRYGEVYWGCPKLLELFLPACISLIR